MTRYRVLDLLCVLVLLASSCDQPGAEVEAPSEGDRAPTFVLPSAAGGNVELSDFSGEKPVLLYFSMGPG